MTFSIIQTLLSTLFVYMHSSLNWSDVLSGSDNVQRTYGQYMSTFFVLNIWVTSQCTVPWIGTIESTCVLLKLDQGQCTTFGKTVTCHTFPPLRQCRPDTHTFISQQFK